MLEVLSHRFPCRWALLEYSELQGVEDFDLSIPLIPSVISSFVQPRYPELVAPLSLLWSQDPCAIVTFDRFASGSHQPDLTSFANSSDFLQSWGVTTELIDGKDFYATVLYRSRNNLVRTIYRNPKEPQTKTDVHNADGSFSHHEVCYSGFLPEELGWGHCKLEKLRALGVNARFSHFKNIGEKSKVYFIVEANG